MSLLGLVASSKYISVNKDLIKKWGLSEAIIFGELCSEYDYWEQEDKLVDGMFFCTVDAMEQATGLSEYQQRTAINHLEELGIVKVILKGMPATRYFYIDETQFLKNFRTSSEKIKELVPEKFKSSNNRHLLNRSLLANSNNNSKENKDNRDKKDTAKTQEFVNLYNEICISLPRVRSITDKREKAIKNITKKYNFEDIRSVLENAQNSDFLTGKNERGWKADIDFILREDKFINILEGKYGGRKRNNVSTEEHTEEKRNADKGKFWEDVKNGKAEKF